MSKLTPWHPFAPLFPRSLNLADRFFGDYLEAPKTRLATWTPRVDVKESPEAYQIQAEVPGLKPSEIEVTLQDKTLTLKGQKTQEEEREEDTFHVVERSYGSFQRTFTFPEAVDSETVVAESDNGVLNITVKKVAEVQPRRIQIKTND